MSWGKIDDGFHRHPKVRRCSLEARGLWATAFSWTADMELDGFIPSDMVPKLAERDDVAALVAELLRVAPPYAVGLWEAIDGGYLMHDYLEINPSARQLAKTRKTTRKRVSRHRIRNAVTTLEHLRKSRRTPGRDGTGRDNTTTSPVQRTTDLAPRELFDAAGGSGDGRGERAGRGTGGGQRKVRSIACSWPADLALTDDLRAFAADGELDPALTWGHFRDHHMARGSTFVDWKAAFRTWCRNAVKFAASRRA